MWGQIFYNSLLYIILSLKLSIIKDVGTLSYTLQLAISTQASIGHPSFTRTPPCCWELEESGTVNVVTVSTTTPSFTMLNQKAVGDVTRTTFMFFTVCDFYL